ncbi:hypothetical protein DRE_00071 [Drechslerella stenobrocha 248]|uniref:Uncharacterized protein n=1 Tax=Drechslerella stenobrocha 248 TaxID=1043628 RepID=W7HX52_9PEZI|nr:hypothetical protein DRE_00071 [Drechslerella stenobrocha 248]
MPSFKQLFLVSLVASASQLCAASPLILVPGAVPEVSVKQPITPTNSILKNAGSLGDRVSIDVGNFVKIVTSDPSNIDLIVQEAFNLVQKVTKDSAAFGDATAKNPTDIGV